MQGPLAYEVTASDVRVQDTSYKHCNILTTGAEDSTTGTLSVWIQNTVHWLST